MGKLKKAHLLWWKALDVSEGNFWNSSSGSTCEYTGVFLGWEQSSIHCFLPALYGELSRRPIFNQLSDKTCLKRRGKRKSCHASSCVASIWYKWKSDLDYPRQTETKEIVQIYRNGAFEWIKIKAESRLWSQRNILRGYLGQNLLAWKV